MMSALLVSTGVVALAEIGDKTQLLALVLAARFRRPWPICLGILFATLANHAAAGLAGAWAGDLLQGPWLRWILGASFLAVAAWTLIPDTLDADEAPKRRFGAFLTTLICFFLVEIGDKTQIATVALAAQYADIVPVVLGTTLGLMIANVPLVFLGQRAAKRLPLAAIRYVAAAIFATFGLYILAGAAMAG
jgi:putative Ca2+/H+ antiporter (TMEM165/GDT1 family)